MKRIIFILLILVYSGSNSLSYAQGQYITDQRDGKTYKTVTVGNQVWLAQNMTYFVKRKSWYYDNDKSNIEKLGLLYSYEGAVKACPAGWHLPSETEWKILFDELGGRHVAGGKMKSTNGWFKPNVLASNTSGFTAIGAGEKLYYGVAFSGYGEVAYFWARNGAFASLGGDHASANTQFGVSSRGFSVRCVKNRGSFQRNCR